MGSQERVPAGSSVQLGLPSFPADVGFVDRLRRAVAADPAVAAAYVVSIAVQEPDTETFAPPRDLIGLDLADPTAEPQVVIQRIGEAVAETVPAGVELSVAVLSETARPTALRAVAPIGAGGKLEVLAAACAQDSAMIPRFVEELLGATLFVPAVADPAGEEGPAGSDGDGRQSEIPVGGEAAGDASLRVVQPGDQVQYPVITVDGQQTIAVFSSWRTLQHADPPHATQLEVSAGQLLANWPDGVALGLDLGTQHGMQIPAADAVRLREAVRGE